MQHVDDCAVITLFPAANSWYVGANVPGKPRVFMPYAAGVDFYRVACDEVVARDYLGFKLIRPTGYSVCRRFVRRLQPDTAASSLARSVSSMSGTVAGRAARAERSGRSLPPVDPRPSRPSCSGTHPQESR